MASIYFTKDTRAIRVDDSVAPTERFYAVDIPQTDAGYQAFPSPVNYDSADPLPVQYGAWAGLDSPWKPQPPENSLGFDLSKMTVTEAERDAMTLGATDRKLIWNSDQSRIEFWNGTEWREITTQAIP